MKRIFKLWCERQGERRTGMAVVQITPDDIAEGEDVDFEEVEERWNIYRLKDGTTLKVKLVLTGVKRLKKHGPDGAPIYVVQSQNVVRAARA